MKYLIFSALIFFLTSCEKNERCYDCEVVLYSNELARCGRANSGFDRESSSPVTTPICGEEALQAAKEAAEKTYTADGFCDGRVVRNVTYMLVLECK